MRVAHIDTGRDMRGGQWQALALMTGLAERGLEQVLLAPADAPLFCKARELGIAVAPVGLLSIWRARADVFHAHDARAHTLAAIAMRGPLVVSRRVAFAVKTGVSSRWKYGRAEQYLAVSKFVERTLLDAGVPAGKILVVYDGVAVPSMSMGERRQAMLAHPSKGRELIIQAAAMARVDVQFSTDLHADLPGAAAFVYISESEGLGSAALLALAHGVPVIASSVGGLPEVVLHLETGLLTGNDPAQIAEALRKLAGDPELARRLGRSGLDLVESQFTTSHMVAGTVSVYERMLS